MKSLTDFKQNPSLINEEEKVDYSKFDILVRAGLANKGQLQRLHRILDKMTDERPQFNNADREIMRNLFNRVIDLISNNKQIFQQARKVVKEGVLDKETSIGTTSDFKISPTTGRKVKAHRFKVGERYGAIQTHDKQQDQYQYGFQEEYIEEDNQTVIPTYKFYPPPLLIIKRKAIRLYPNGTNIALYYSDKLNKYFSIPYSTKDTLDSVIQSESFELSKIDELKMIKESNEFGVITHNDNSKSAIDAETAGYILEMYNELNDTNKSKINTMIESSSIELEKLITFIKEL